VTYIFSGPVFPCGMSEVAGTHSPGARKELDEEVDGASAHEVKNNTEEWIDFVNQVTPHKQQETMRKPLAGGWRGCAEKLARRHKVRTSAATNANFQPPAQTARIMKAGGQFDFFAICQIVRNHRRSKILSASWILTPLYSGLYRTATRYRYVPSFSFPAQQEVHFCLNIGS
jgi:hypothetical protein